MSIQKSGRWWVGRESQDIQQFLEAYAPRGFEVREFRLARCICGGERFKLLADDEEGFAERVCVACGRHHLVCDSDEYQTEAKPQAFKCVECGLEEANIGVGFSLYEGDGEIRWLYVGVRCPRCGVLGCFAGWKIGFSPSRHLLDRV